MSNFEGMPPEMAELARRQQRNHELDRVTAVLRDAGSERIERDILCDLWRDLGDGTETYWQAMAAVTAFVDVDRFVFGKMDQLSHPVRLRVMDAIAGTIKAKADLQREMAAKREEFLAAHPLPGDHP